MATATASDRTYATGRRKTAIARVWLRPGEGKMTINDRIDDDYFKQRRLYPNVDFYTGVIYKAMGFPTRMFTVLFAIGRLPGWIAQWKEMLESPETKIGRPRQVYTGSDARDYVAIEQR